MDSQMCNEKKFDINFHYCPAKISDYFAPLTMTGLNFHIISIRRPTEKQFVISIILSDSSDKL